jgi:ABC-2 type transport system permease protein
MTRVQPIALFRTLTAMNLRMLRRKILLLREQSWLMIAVIASFVIGYWGASYLLFHNGFRFLANLPGVGALVVERMLYLFFAFLFVMLVFSNMIIGYAALYKSQETQWLLTLPVPAYEVFRWKLIETAVLASWAFLFLSAPMIVAYGGDRHAGPLFYIKVFLLFLPFTLIPAAVGSGIVLLVTRYLHRRIFKLALFAMGTIMLIVCAVLVKPISAAELQESQMITALDQMLRNSNFTRSPWLPSSWVAQSMIAWGEPAEWRGMFFFLVVLSNALMALVICLSASGRIFYDGWSRNHSQGSFKMGVEVLDKKLTLPRSWFLEPMLSLIPRMDPCTRALVVKDIRVFWRDTSQWSQFVIFFGLLGLYVINLRHVAPDWQNEYWAVFVAFLNLSASSMTLGTLTTRFVFPQFSMEGKRLWIVGMLPYGLKRVLLQKFWLSSFAAMLITVSLTSVSCYMLHVPAWLTLLFGATGVLMSFALCGIAVGIGALFPNFGTGSTANRRDDNPAKIVSGFGGTFCFVLSLVYIALVISAEALPMWLQLSGGLLTREQQPWAMVIAWVFVSVLSLIATMLPMHLALKHVENLEI